MIRLNAKQAGLFRISILMLCAMSCKGTKEVSDGTHLITNDDIYFVVSDDYPIHNNAIYARKWNGDRDHWHKSDEPFLLTTGRYHFSPVWNYKGDKVYYLDLLDGRYTYLTILDVASGQKTQYSNPKHTPIFFSMDQEESVITYEEDGIWIMDLASEELTLLVTEDDSTGHFGHPRISPDGKLIAFISFGSGLSDIDSRKLMVLNAETGKIIHTGKDGDLIGPSYIVSWHENSRKLLFRQESVTEEPPRIRPYVVYDVHLDTVMPPEDPPEKFFVQHLRYWRNPALY